MRCAVSLRGDDRVAVRTAGVFHLATDFALPLELSRLDLAVFVRCGYAFCECGAGLRDMCHEFVSVPLSPGLLALRRRVLAVGVLPAECFSIALRGDFAVELRLVLRVEGRPAVGGRLLGIEREQSPVQVVWRVQ